jgi:hypothetical protein
MASVGPVFKYYFLDGNIQPFLQISADYHFAELDKDAFAWTWVYEIDSYPYYSKAPNDLKGPLKYDMIGAGLGSGVMFSVKDGVSMGGTLRFDCIGAIKEEKQEVVGSFGRTLKSRLLYMPLTLSFTAAFVF